VSGQPKQEPEVRSRVSPLLLPLCGTALLTLFPLLPWVRANARLAGSFWGAAGGLLLFLLVLCRHVLRSGCILGYEFLPRPVHYVQLAMHSSIYAYWGWYWREVYHYIPLILAQIIFVYVLDMLVCWSRRDKWILGFGPFPIVLSTNLFLWFKDDWYFLQFLMVATGVLCKEFISWKRDGRRTHIFNPSAIALAIFSVGLLITRSTPISWGEEVAVTLSRPPNIYIEIFLLGLVVQALFSVTLITLSAAGALYVLNVLYTRSTGVYFFVDSNIPAAVFLGLHLLVTDPATSPRKNFAKILFGAMYGAGVFGLYAMLTRVGAPTYYDKLLCVPPLNLIVQALDHGAVALAARLRSFRLRPLEWLSRWTPRQANFAHMGIWMALFAVMLTTGFVGGNHPGANLEFWRRACDEGKRNACQTWTQTMSVACQHGGGHACLNLGLVLYEGRVAPKNASEAGKYLARACDLGTPFGCPALITAVQRDGPRLFQGGCHRGDGESCFILASLYYGGKGVPKD